MPKFTDSKGREWLVAIDGAAAVKRVRTLTGIDIWKAADAGLDQLRAVLADVVALADVLYAVVRPEADARKVSDEEFAAGLSGDVLEAAATALVEAVIDFFPTARRDQLRRAVAIGRAVLAEILVRENAELAELEADPLALLRPSDSTTGSPESAAPTPTA